MVGESILFRQHNKPFIRVHLTRNHIRVNLSKSLKIRHSLHSHPTCALLHTRLGKGPSLLIKSVLTPVTHTLLNMGRSKEKAAALAIDLGCQGIIISECLPVSHTDTDRN